MGKPRTLLDHYISTCVTNVTLPVCGEMATVIHDLKPLAHKWTDWSESKNAPLPREEITWPDQHMCLYSPNTSICLDPYRMCVDIDYIGEGFDSFFQSATWELSGALVFQLNSKVFDVIPLVAESSVGMLVLPEMQLHYTLTDTGWAWEKAVTGPVNALFHSFFMSLIDNKDIDDVYEAVNMLGNTMQLYLGAYHQWLQKPGSWKSVAPRKPRVKMKKGKVKKFYDEGSAGYKEYIHTEES